MNFFASLGRRARDELDKAMRIPAGQPPQEIATSSNTEPPELEVLFSVHDRSPPPEIQPRNQSDMPYKEPIKYNTRPLLVQDCF